MHIGWHQRIGGQFGRVHPDAHGVFGAEHLQTADAFYTRHRILHVADQPVGDIGAGGFIVFVIHREDQQEAALRFLHRYARLLNFARQTGFRLLHFVLHLNLGGIRIGTLLKGDGNADRAVGAAGGCKVEQVVQSGELLLNNLGDAVFQGFRRGAGVGGGDFYRRRGDVRILGDRQGADSQNPGEHNQNGDNPGEDRASHEETGEHQALPPSFLTSAALTCWPGATLPVPSTISRSPLFRPLTISHLSP